MRENTQNSSTKGFEVHNGCQRVEFYSCRTKVVTLNHSDHRSVGELPWVRGAVCMWRVGGCSDGCSKRTDVMMPCLSESVGVLFGVVWRKIGIILWCGLVAAAGVCNVW